MNDVTRVLVVDDDDQMRSALEKSLTKLGYAVTTAANGQAATKVLGIQMFELALFDVRMPGISGIELVSVALETDPELAIVMLSGINDAHTAAVCMQRGAMDYLTKPVDLEDLRRSIDQSLRRRDSRMQDAGISDWVHEELAARTGELEREKRRLEDLSVATLEALINALEAKDSYQAGHSARVADLAATIAAHLDLSDFEIDTVRSAGRLHDLGKIGIRESVLNKSGPLTEDEYAHVKEHVNIGARILEPLAYLGVVRDYVRSHHEHWDGSGYPEGLRGEEIPLGGRIICAAEIYDALTTERPYQETLDRDQAIDRMGVLGGTALDPRVLDALQRAVRKRKTLTFVTDITEKTRGS
ncbi:MAG: HD domain-containing phosphohydrolase [Gemmatimonadales bacterium]